MASRGATGGAGRAAEGEEDRDRGVGVAKEGEWTVARPPTPFMDEHGVSKVSSGVEGVPRRWWWG